MAYGDTGGGAAAPYKIRRRRKLLAKKLSTGLKANRPKPPVPRQVGGGVAAPKPFSTEPVKSAPYQGRKAREWRFSRRPKSPRRVGARWRYPVKRY